MNDSMYGIICSVNLVCWLILVDSICAKFCKGRSWKDFIISVTAIIVRINYPQTVLTPLWVHHWFDSLTLAELLQSSGVARDDCFSDMYLFGIDCMFTSVIGSIMKYIVNTLQLQAWSASYDETSDDQSWENFETLNKIPFIHCERGVLFPM